VTDAGKAAAVARAVYETLDADREHFVLLTLNNKNRLIGQKVISSGSVKQTLAGPREVFIAALELRAVAIICVHNHPAGDPAPSPDDISLTTDLKKAADLLGIRFLDHIILGDRCHFSFSEKGML
jgi:DNA repair protein RadC